MPVMADEIGPRNGGFEEGKPGGLPTGWQLWGHDAARDPKDFAVDGAVAHSGSQSLRILQPQGAHGYIVTAVRDNLVAVHTNRVYTFSFYIKADCPGPAAVRIEAQRSDDRRAVQTVFDRTFNVDATWQRVAFTVTEGVAVFADEYDRFMLCLYAAPAGQPQPTRTVWIDDVSIDERSAPAGNVRLINPRTLAYAPLNHRLAPGDALDVTVHADKPVRRATPDDYVAHLKAVGDAIRAAHPEGLIGVGIQYSDLHWGNYVLAAGAGHYDFVCGHWYSFINVRKNPLDAVAGGENYRLLDAMLRMNALLRLYNPGRDVCQYDTEWSLHSNAAGTVPGTPQNGNIVGALHRAVRLIYYLREDIVRGASAWEMFSSPAKHRWNSLGLLAPDEDRQAAIYWVHRCVNEYVGEQVLAINGTTPYYRPASNPATWSAANSRPSRRYFCESDVDWPAQRRKFASTRPTTSRAPKTTCVPADKPSSFPMQSASFARKPVAQVLTAPTESGSASSVSSVHAGNTPAATLATTTRCGATCSA